MRQGSRSSREQRSSKRFVLLACLSALSLIASASPAAASVTLGQLAPGSPPATKCTGVSTDFLQPSVDSGSSYVVPSTGTITSWSTNAAAPAGQTYTMKVFRQIAGATYGVVGHDGPRTLTGGVLNTFPASVPVNADDVIGFSEAAESRTHALSWPTRRTLTW